MSQVWLWHKKSVMDVVNSDEGVLVNTQDNEHLL